MMASKGAEKDTVPRDLVKTVTTAESTEGMSLGWKCQLPMTKEMTPRRAWV